jgi:hypothetical protein
MPVGTGFEYPRVVLAQEALPLAGPLPYAGNNMSDTLEFFCENPSEEQWARYNQWNQAFDENQHRGAEGLVVIDGDVITKAQA